MTQQSQLDIPGSSLAQTLEGQWGGRLIQSVGDPDGTLVIDVVGPHFVPGFASQSVPVLSTTDIAGLSLSGAGQNVDIDLVPSGTALSAQPSTLFYVYIEYALSANPSLVASLVAPTLVDGIYLLNNTGQGIKAFFLGWIRMDSGGRFVNTDAARCVVNYYNRRPTRIRLRPAYSDNNANTTFSLNTATWARANGGTGDTAEYIANGEDAIHVHAQYTLGAVAPAAVIQVGIGDNSNTQPSSAAAMGSAAISGSSAACSLCVTPAVGYRTLTMLGMTGGLATTFAADYARNGAAADPSVTSLYAMIPT